LRVDLVSGWLVVISAVAKYVCIKTVMHTYFVLLLCVVIVTVP